MRSDANQREIVKSLREAGASVTILSKVGRGCPDLLVGYAGKNYLFEVKSEKGILSKRQIEWISDWRGSAMVVRSAEQALQALGLQPKTEKLKDNKVLNHEY